MATSWFRVARMWIIMKMLCLYYWEKGREGKEMETSSPSETQLSNNDFILFYLTSGEGGMG